MRKLKNSELVLILILLTMLVYSESLSNGFAWDDFPFIVDNPYIRQFKFLPDLFFKSLNATSPTGSGFDIYYRPFFLLSFMIDYHLWGLNPFPYHLINTFLYITVVALIFIFILKLTRNKLLSFLTALFFSLHPIHTDAVTPIHNRMDLMVSLFIFCALITFIYAANAKRLKAWLYAASLLVFIFALLAKEFAIILPVLFVLYDLYFLSDFKIKNMLVRKFFYLGCALIAMAYLYIRLFVLGKEFIGYYSGPRFTSFYYPTYSFWWPVVIIQTFYQYLKLLFWPMKLSCAYLIPIRPLWHIEIIVTVILLSLVLFFAFKFRNRYRIATFMVYWFFITLFPILNIIPFGNRISEHYVFLASLSFCFLLASLLAKAIESKRLFNSDILTNQKITILIIFLICCFYGYKTLIRNYDWRHEFVLWNREVQTNPRSPLPHTNLGVSYFKQGLYDQAINEYNLALSIQPNEPHALLALGVILTQKGLFDEGIKIMTEAAKFDPNNASIYAHLGRAYGMAGKFDLAIESHQKALTLNPIDLTSLYDLGIDYFNSNRLQEAEAQFNKVLELDPNYSLGYYGLGLVFMDRGEAKKAIEMFQYALKLDPFYQNARDKLIELNKRQQTNLTKK